MKRILIGLCLPFLVYVFASNSYAKELPVYDLLAFPEDGCFDVKEDGQCNWIYADELAAIGYRSFQINSGSMMPTLLNGDIVVTSLEVVEPSRGEIVVFEYPFNRSRILVSRVIGIPGDVIDYQDKTLFNNKVEFSRMHKTDYVFPRHNISEYFEFQPNSAYGIFLDTNLKSRDMIGITVPPDHYFVMGDNRDHSNDSRFWGFVPKSHLRGIHRLTLPTITGDLDEVRQAYEEAFGISK